MTLSAAALYFYTKDLLRREIEEELYSNKDRVENLLAKDQEIRGIPPIMEIEKVNREEAEILKDTLLYDPLQDEIELFRQLSGTHTIAGKHYRVTVRAMIIESEDILFAIVFTFIIVLFLAFIFLFYLNKSRNEKLWKPFFVNLDKLKGFSLKSNDALSFEDSDVLEFHELNREMTSLTAKIQTDYRNLKQFTEDVSHEMQTPLAIMQVKIDTIINDAKITKKQFESLSSLQTDISRLKQLNKKLILLAKIENNQFSGAELISINSILKESISNFRELAPVEIEFRDQEEIHANMDRSLASILCNNLLSNAIKHNTKEGPIIVVAQETHIQFINHGKYALAGPEHIFERFYRESKKEDSTGLGLSIVKKICDYYGFEPSYHFRESCHVFQIDFKLQS
ncbi:MAG: two-component sensor histidine kinase [Cytophagaceae bacterium]|nr:two-component sensor histidine kinase [Cytophagaceae bacterium]